VLCPDPSGTEKRRRPIRTGHPGFDLVPIVIDSSAPPGGDNPGPYLTVFAAAMGGIDLESEPGLRRVADALASTDLAQLGLWFDRAITASSAAEVFAG
jgi:hypothetical protein